MTMLSCKKFSLLINIRRQFSSVIHDSSRECFVQDLDNGFSKIFLNRPQKLNSLGKNILKELKECIDHVHNKRVVVIESKCEKAFCSGADLKERLKMDVNETESFVDDLRNTFTSLSEIDAPSVACIDGIAFGGGLELALACDIRVASYKSRVGFPETKLAIFPAAGGTQRLSWLVGPAKAKELIFAAEIIEAEYAKIIGILNHVHENPSSLCDAIASKILQNGPLGVSGAKKAIDASFHQFLNDGLKAEKYFYSQLLRSEDRVEGLTAFNEKRSPKYTGK